VLEVVNKQGGASASLVFCPVWMHFVTLQSSAGSGYTGLSNMHLRAVQVGEKGQKTERISGVSGKVPGYISEDNLQRGFTLVELITIIVILGIMAVVAAPRFFEKNTFDSRGYYDQVISTLRFAQKTAIAQHRVVCVAFDANIITLTIDSDVPADGACNAAPAGNLTGPSGLSPYSIEAPGDVTFTAPAADSTFSFDSLGRAIAPPGVISVSGYSGSITVEAETGYVH
jgi:MSHA pilin protein MshC